MCCSIRARCWPELRTLLPPQAAPHRRPTIILGPEFRLRPINSALRVRQAPIRFFALSVDPSIADVQVVSSAPGTVNVYVLTGPISVQPASSPNYAGIAGTSLLGEVQAALTADTVRPLTDTVVTSAVTEVDYQINAIVTLYSDADPNQTMAAAATAIQQYAIDIASKIQSRPRAKSDHCCTFGSRSVRGNAQLTLSRATHRGTMGQLHQHLTRAGGEY